MTIDIELDAAELFITNMNTTSICEYIVAQQKAIDGLTDNNRQLRAEFRKLYKEILKLKYNKYKKDRAKAIEQNKI